MNIIIKILSLVKNFQILKYLIKKIYVLKIFGKVNILKSLAGFELMTCRFVVNSPNHCTTPLDNNFGREAIYKIILGCIVSFDK